MEMGIRFPGHKRLRSVSEVPERVVPHPVEQTVVIQYLEPLQLSVVAVAVVAAELVLQESVEVPVAEVPEPEVMVVLARAVRVIPEVQGIMFCPVILPGVAVEPVARV
jgi:hypothetical protein